MLVVISDLHFEEEAANQIPGDGTHEGVVFHRNLSARPYRVFIQRLARDAARNRARRLDLVLAGDIFDLHRTGLWFWENPTGARPYVSTADVASPLEAMILRILQGITTEQGVKDVLAALRLLAQGRYLDDAGNERPFPVPVQLHYLPGNHDRMANATPAIRRAVREALGLPAGDDPFPHVLSFPAEQAMVRHGHEYDFTNFATDHRETAEFPLHLPTAQYQEAPFGDFATVDVASRLPFMFRRHYGDGRILADETLRALYLRLLEFDDLRPLTAILNYFLHGGATMIDPEVAWRAIQDVVIDWLEELHDDPFLHTWLDRFDKKGFPDAIDAVQAVLSLKAWRWTGTVPLSLAQSIANFALRSSQRRPGAETFAARESTIRNGRHLFVIAGHTHRPKVELVAHDARGERYYLDTGTWRNRVPATPDFDGFGRLKALTYVLIYGPEEDRGTVAVGDIKVASFDFWTGFTQGWTQRKSASADT